MKQDSGSRASKRLSWLLRHGAGETGIDMDAAGWVSVSDVLRALGISRSALETAVVENDKSRLELRGSRIRACQGHSLLGMPVTHAALEASWDEHPGDESVWHGTRIAALEGIARAGIHAGERTHVHLAEAIDSTVGKRASVDVMLEVAPARLRASGLRLYRSGNGVLLVRAVPADCLVGITPMTDRARRQEPALRATLGLPPAGPALP